MGFIGYVNRVLLHNNQSIHRFRLWGYNNFNPFYIDKWVSTAIARNIRELLISILLMDEKVILPSSSLFTCQSLEFLELEGTLFISEPSLGCLPRLDNLQLQSVWYETDESVSKILSGCPILKSLHIERGQYDNVAAFRISSSTVKSLKLLAHDEGESMFFYYEAYALYTYFADGIHVKLEICAPALEDLYLTDRVSHEVSLDSPTSLVQAMVNFFCLKARNEPEIQHQNCPAVKLLQALDHVRFLTISSNTMIALSHAATHLSVKFLRLSKLEVRAGSCELSPLKDLLGCADNLEVLNFTKVPCHQSKGFRKSCWRKSTEAPKCLLSSLREISIRGYNGLEDELAMTRYILKHGRVLRR